MLLLIILIALLVVCPIMAKTQQNIPVGTPATADLTVTVHNFTFRDDNGDAWIITASSLMDAYAILRDDYCIADGYYQRHMFLAHSERVF
jgi:hypothetical protein